MNDWLPGLLKALRAGYGGYAGAQQYNVQQQQYGEEQHRKALLDMMRQQQYEQQFGLSQEKHAETVRHHGVMEQPEPEEPPKIPTTVQGLGVLAVMQPDKYGYILNDPGYLKLLESYGTGAGKGQPTEKQGLDIQAKKLGIQATKSKMIDTGIERKKQEEVSKYRPHYTEYVEGYEGDANTMLRLLEHAAQQAQIPQITEDKPGWFTGDTTYVNPAQMPAQNVMYWDQGGQQARDSMTTLLNLLGGGKGAPSQGKTVQNYDSIIQETSQMHGVRPELIAAIITAESAGRHDSVSSAGAKGLMQLMPETAEEMGVRNIFDPQDNIKGGVKYFSRLLELYNNNEELALAAYNAGPGNVEKYGGIPPFRETQEYVKKVLKLAGKSFNGTADRDSEMSQIPIRELLKIAGYPK